MLESLPFLFLFCCIQFIRVDSCSVGRLVEEAWWCAGFRLTLGRGPGSGGATVPTFLKTFFLFLKNYLKKLGSGGLGELGCRALLRRPEEGGV